MPTLSDNALLFYQEHGMITDPGRYTPLFEDLPQDIPQLRDLLQGLLIHVVWAERYGEKLSEERRAGAGIRHVERILSEIQGINDAPIIQPRPLNERFVGNCRTYSVVLTSMLRNLGIPARARCGFGRYFKPDWYEDHWVCEYWSSEQQQWILLDAQLDDLQCKHLGIEFDPLDVPRDQFIVGGAGWTACREGKADPNKFGIFDMHGLWFVRGNLIRDIAAINKMELLPWDGWGLIEREDDHVSEEELQLLDNVAAMTGDEVDFPEVREAYDAQEGLQVPPIIQSHTQSGTIEIDLSSEQAVGQL